jgi:hypothetical protein
MNLGIHVILRMVIVYFKHALDKGEIRWDEPSGVVMFPEADLSPMGKRLFQMLSCGAAHLIPFDGGYCLLDFLPKGEAIYKVSIKLVFEGDRPSQNDDIWKELLLKAGFGDVETTAGESGMSCN